MPVTKIRIENLVGQTRATAFAPSGLPVGLFMDRWFDRRHFTRWKNQDDARIRKIARQQGGAFAELSTGESVFVANSDLGNLNEGAAFRAETVAEARSGKVARVRPARSQRPSPDPLSTWIAQLPGGPEAETLSSEQPDDEIEAAFDIALGDNVTLPGGGTLRIASTPALVAVDLDTAGRTDRGRAAQRASAINRKAVRELARQVALRDLGGAVVLDCVAPLSKDDGAILKTAYLDAFRSNCTRKVEALVPSPFGLMETTSAWRYRPIGDVIAHPNGTLRTESRIQAALRDLEREACQNRARSLRLEIPLGWKFAAYSAETGVETALGQRYGARFEIVDADGDAAQIKHL